jgi:uncharacterized protein (DUF433 family)
MTKLQEIEAILPDLSASEKALVLQWIARDMSGAFAGIEKTPGVSGGDACIVRTRIPVWLLVNMKRLGMNESQILASYPSLRAEDLVNAWAYAETHADEIEQAIFENE